MTETYSTLIETHLEISARKILFAIVDQSNVRIKHPELFNKVYEMTYGMTMRLTWSGLNGDVKYFDNIDLAMISSENYDLVIIQSIGNFIKHNQFFELLNNYVNSNPNFFLLAFTLDWQSEKGTGWIEVHNQMMVVNVKTWKSLGRPFFGNWETIEEELPIYSRSEENFHDRYTPYWIKGESGTVRMIRSGQGWNFIKTALLAGLRIDNFSEEMRSCRLFVYPEHESELLWQAFNERNPNILNNPNQKKWIRQIFLSRPQVWIFNSEFYRFNINLKNIDLYVGPASGFKYLDFLNYNPKGQFIFYDFNQYSLDWLKSLKENWDGENYYKYLSSQSEETKSFYKFIHGNKFNKENIEKNLKILFRDFESEEKFKTLWNIFRQSSTQFIKINLFDDNDLDLLFEKIDSRTLFFNYSNIFANDFTLAYYTREQVEQGFDNLYQRLDKNKFFYIGHGSDIDGQWETIHKTKVNFSNNQQDVEIKYSSVTENFINKNLITPLTFFDIGCSGGIHKKLRIFEPLLKGFGVDPIIEECADLHSKETNPNIRYIPCFIHGNDDEMYKSLIIDELKKPKAERNRIKLRIWLRKYNAPKLQNFHQGNGNFYHRLSAFSLGNGRKI